MILIINRYITRKVVCVGIVMEVVGCSEISLPRS